jgi:Mg2+ and Co2+ transporter CorA
MADMKLIESIVKGIAPVLEEYEARLTRLEQRFVEMETKIMRFEGIWEAGKTYPAGSVVTRSGSA